MTASALTPDIVDELLRDAVAQQCVPGVAAIAADTQGVVYEGYVGASSPSQQWSPATVALLTSLTKVIVSVAALRLVDRGELELDAPVHTIVPELREPKVLIGFGIEREPILRPAKHAITLRHLLTHTAGFGYQFWNADVAQYQERLGLPSITECRNSTLTVPLLFEPGSKWNYGMNLDWVGKAIEAVSGLRLDAYLRQEIFQPLDMKDTGFVLTESMRRRLAAMYAGTEDGPVPIEFELNQEPEFQSGGAGLYGTARDFMRFLQALLVGEAPGRAPLLRPETFAAATRNQIGELSIGPFISVDPQSSRDVELIPGVLKKWGLIGMINTAKTPAGRSAGSLSWLGLTNCYFWIDWNNENTGLLFTQLLPFGDPGVLQLFHRFEQIIHGL